MADRGAGSQLWPMDYRLLSIFFALAFGCGSSGSPAGGDDGGDLGDAGVAFDATVPEGDAGIGTDDLPPLDELAIYLRATADLAAAMLSH